ncbi:MAG: 2-polyprenyl-3-methyl-5-hydroxy-6-metoxy-1,4-benzoquinol methylase, partial [Candidatus Methanomarinus sp.]
MLEKEIKEIISLYEARLKEYGDNVKTMGWRDKEQQHLRFRILSDIGDLNGSKILDVGCGFGDFYEYLVDKGIKVDYTGYDISLKIINVAISKHPQIRFEVKDILKERIDEKFDYVLESGILNKKISNNIGY